MVSFTKVTTFGHLVIGLNDLKKEGEWVWYDESRPEFTYWALGEPNDYHTGEDFAVIMLMNKDGRIMGEWNDSLGNNENDKPGRVIFEWDFVF